jgi:hypothetical protein
MQAGRAILLLSVTGSLGCAAPQARRDEVRTTKATTSGDVHGFDSIDPHRRLSDLSVAELRSYCEWAARVTAQVFASPVECDGQRVQGIPRSSCHLETIPRECSATVEDMALCTHVLTQLMFTHWCELRQHRVDAFGTELFQHPRCGPIFAVCTSAPPAAPVPVPNPQDSGTDQTW